MSKSKKKRTKAYTGADAARGPHVTRYTVKERSGIQEWLHENKKLLISRGIFVGAALLVSWLIYLLVY